MDRKDKILELRPKIDLTINGNKSLSEDFMHVSLRPILKLQHELICSLLSHQKHMNLPLLTGKASSEQEKRIYLTDLVLKNTDLKNRLIGMILGLFTLDELEHYFLDVKSLNKRIIDMVITRYLSTFTTP